MNIIGCTKTGGNDSNYNNEPTITFIEDLDRSKIAVKQTDDGGYIVGGQESGNAWMTKLDKYGSQEWENTYSLEDHLGYTRAVIQTNDGGYLYGGWGGIVKADSNGMEEWKNNSREYGAFPYYEDVIQHSNGSYYAVGGPGQGQAQFVKFDSNGNVLTRKWFGGNCEDDIFRSIVESPDNMLVIAGEKSHGNQSYKCAFNFMYYKDFWVVKVKKGGALIWEKTFGGPYLEQADDIVNLQDGGFGVIGAKCSHNYDISSCRSVAKVLYMKIDSDGNLMEEKSWSGLEFFERLPYFSIANTSIGGISWTAEHKRKGTWIHKWGPNEDTVNVYTIGSGGFDINRTEDGGFIIGTMSGNLIKTDSELFFNEISNNGIQE